VVIEKRGVNEPIGSLWWDNDCASVSASAEPLGKQHFLQANAKRFQQPLGTLSHGAAPILGPHHGVGSVWFLLHRSVLILPGHRIAESQNAQGWQGPLWVTQLNPLPKQGHPEQAAQHRVQVGLEYLQRRRLVPVA